MKDDLAGDHDIGEYKWDPEGSDFKGKPMQNRFAMGMDSPSPGWGSARTEYLGTIHEGHLQFVVIFPLVNEKITQLISAIVCF